MRERKRKERRTSGDENGRWTRTYRSGKGQRRILPQKRGKGGCRGKKMGPVEGRRKPSMAAAWVERGALTSTIAAGSRRIDEGRGREKDREKERSIMRRKISGSLAENRSANGVARHAALIISNGSCELFLSASRICFPTTVRNNLCSHWWFARVCVEKARKWTRKSRVTWCRVTSRLSRSRKGKAVPTRCSDDGRRTINRHKRLLPIRYSSDFLLQLVFTRDAPS